MEITIGQLVNGSGAIAMLNSQALPGRQALLLARLTKVLAPELQSYQESRLKVFQRFGVENKEQNRYDWKDNTAQAAGEAELKELWDTKIRLSFSPLPDALLDHIEISPDALESVMWLFEENP